jgi:diguanylate cyclase (GGDEF)-like protein
VGLDIPTLFVVAACVATLLGLFLFLAWIQDRSVRALGLWAAAYVIGGSAVAFWSMPISLLPPTTVDVPSALLFLACGMIWSGVRLFHGRPVLPWAMAAGAFAWLMIGNAFTPEGETRIAISAAIIAIYAFLTSVELQRDRRRSPSRWRSVFVPLLHCAIFLFPIVFNVLQTGGEPHAPFGAQWFVALALQTFIYSVGTAFLVLCLVKERDVHIHKTAAATDPLTGVYNRRGFVEAARRALEWSAGKGEQVTVLAFDLDHFKSINDRFGHALGDVALTLFAQVAANNMRASDVIGRLGGEEFAAVIPSGIDDAAVVAERVRAAFETAGVEIGGARVGATVSIGAACARASAANLHDLLARADAALYRAKEDGRNRVTVDEGKQAGAGLPVIFASTPAKAQAQERAPAPPKLATVHARPR